MKKKILIIISVVVGILLIAGGTLAYFNFRPPTEEQVRRYEQTMSEGEILFEAREYSEAVKKYNQAARIINKDGRAYSRIVDIYLLKNDFETALEVAQKAQDYATVAQVSLIYANIAERYFEVEDFYNARMNYEIASSLNDNPKVNFGLAKAYVYDGEIDLAKKLLAKEYDSENVDKAKLLYSYILGLEDTKKAKDFVSNYTPNNKDMSSYFDEYSSTLDSLEEDELFNSAKVARVYVNNNYPTLAIKLLEPKEEEIAQYVDALYYLGKAYLDTKQYDKAVSTLQKSASLIGYESDKYWMLARAYYKKDDLVNSISYYDMAVGYAGDGLSRELVEEYLNILLDSNQINKTQEVYTDIVKTMNSSWLYLIGLETYYKAEGSAKFDYYLNKLANMEMNDNQEKEYLFWKIRGSLEGSRMENVEEELGRLLVLDRFNPRYYWMKGVYSLSLSDTQEAKDSFELALEYDLDGDVTKEVEKLLAPLQ
jgi:tetratricopeptide (TPR) repeat protein